MIQGVDGSEIPNERSETKAKRPASWDRQGREHLFVFLNVLKRLGAGEEDVVLLHHVWNAHTLSSTLDDALLT